MFKRSVSRTNRRLQASSAPGQGRGDAGALLDGALYDDLVSTGNADGRWLIGGADVAAELDARRAIAQGTRVAASLSGRPMMLVTGCLVD